MAVPPTVMPENSFLAKMIAPKKPPQANLLHGFGASPGTVTARACVLRSPEDFGQMRPGDVIVAVITTPPADNHSGRDKRNGDAGVGIAE